MHQLEASAQNHHRLGREILQEATHHQCSLSLATIKKFR